MRLSVVGATGSIGGHVRDVIRQRGGIEMVGMSCGTHVEKLAPLIRELRPKYAAVADEDRVRQLRSLLGNTKTRIFGGPEAALDACVRPEVDLVVLASVGLDAFTTTIEAVKLGRNIAPASKEPFVFGSEIILPIAKANNVKVRPVDSELSAIWQIVLEYNLAMGRENGSTCVVGVDTSQISRIWLGCSGGPFYGMTWEAMRNATPEMVLRHPTWAMGKLVTTNSATLENKGQEMAETRAMFNVGLEKVGATIDRTSNTHAVVEFKDGTVLANISKPTMDDPVRFAIYGERRESDVQPGLNIKIAEPDSDNFRLLRRMREATEAGGTMPAVQVAANDAAVEAFHDRMIGFTEMVEIVEEVMGRHRVRSATEQSIRESYNWASWVVRDMVLSRHGGNGVEDEHPR